MAITRFRNSSIRNGTPKYNDIQAGLPFRPVIGTATDGGTGTTVSVAFTGNNVANGTVTYTALSSPGNITATGAASPITVSGLTAGTAYTFQVKAGNSLGDSAYSAASNSVTPVQPTAFESIATATGTGSSNTITFSSIPGTYQHLQLRCLSRTTTATTGLLNLRVRFNSDTTDTNYAYHRVGARSGGSVSASGSADTQIAIENCCPRNGNLSNTMGFAIVDIHDYASTTKNKVMRSFSGYENNGADVATAIYLGSGLWTSTSALTSITITNGESGNFTTSSVFALYGIKGS